MKTADIIAFTLIGGCLILKFFGIDSTVDTILIGIAAFYFGSKFNRGEK